MIIAGDMGTGLHACGRACHPGLRTYVWRTKAAASSSSLYLPQVPVERTTMAGSEFTSLHAGDLWHPLLFTECHCYLWLIWKRHKLKDIQREQPEKIPHVRVACSVIQAVYTFHLLDNALKCDCILYLSILQKLYKCKDKK